MAFFTKDLLLGGCLGAVLGVTVLVGGCYLVVKNRLSAFGGMDGALEAGLQPPPLPGDTPRASYGWAIRSLDGREVPFEEFRGRVVVLNFWATWCPPCRAELPSLQRLYETLKGEEVAFAIVSNEAPEKVESFVREKGYSFPVFTIRDRPPAPYATRAVPATFVLSPDGGVALHHEGAARWDDERVVAFIRGLRQ